MKNFFSCVSKDLKLFGRSKVSAFVTIVIPLLIVLFIGFAFNSTTLQGIKIGVYSSSFSDITESLIDDFEEQSYKVIKENSEEECIKNVKYANTAICIVFPPNLKDIGNEYPIVFNADDSRVNIVYTLIESIKTKVTVKSSETGENLVNEIISVLNNAQADLEKEKQNLKDTEAGFSEIDSKADETLSSVSDLDNVIGKIEDAKTIAEKLNSSDSEVIGLKTKLDETIIDANLVKDGFESVDEIKSKNTETKIKINKISGQIDEILENLKSLRTTEAEEIVSPIKTEIKPINAGLKNSDFLFPTLLALTVLFGSTILASVMVLKEKKTRAYFRNFITPTNDFTFFISLYISCLIILVFQIAVLLTGLYFIVDLPLFNYLFSILLILFISASAFIFMGMFIGYLFKNEEVALLVSISVLTLFLFFSNTILPLETVTGDFQRYASYNPLVVTDSILKKVILFNLDLGSLMNEIYILLAIFTIFLVLAFVSRKATKRFV